jgi:carbamoyl-phosphate synthase large subunit
MASTGEVGCLGDDFDEAFLKALLAVGYKLELRNVLLSTGPIEAKAAFLGSARLLIENKVNLFASYGTAAFLIQNNVPVTPLHWPMEERTPNMMELIVQRKFDLVINIPKNYQQEELSNGYLIRRQSANFGIPLITNLQLAKRFVEALAAKKPYELEIKSWQDYRRPYVKNHRSSG